MVLFYKGRQINEHDLLWRVKLIKLYCLQLKNNKEKFLLNKFKVMVENKIISIKLKKKIVFSSYIKHWS